MRSLQLFLDGFAVKEVRNSLLIDELLVEICTDLYKKDVITNVMAVVNALLKREQIGGLGIPGTSLALFHTRSAFCSKSGFRNIHIGSAYSDSSNGSFFNRSR
ncbi:hypothetical protein GCM10020331_003130 [Ectobacillus funiculus]